MKATPPPHSSAVTGPLFRQVAGSLAASIREGDFSVGSLLPTEHELARRYGVSRHTVRQAFTMLRSEGLIASRQGVGTVVVSQAARSAYTEAYSSIEELTTYAQGHPIHIDSMDEVIADAALATAIGCAAGQAFLRIQGRRYDRDGKVIEPICHVTAYVDARFGAIKHRLRVLKGAIVQALEEEFGLTVTRITQEIQPSVIPKELATPLKAEVASPSLTITRWYHGADDRVFEIAQSHYPIGRFTYRTELIRRRPP